MTRAVGREEQPRLVDHLLAMCSFQAVLEIPLSQIRVIKCALKLHWRLDIVALTFNSTSGGQRQVDI